MKAQLAHHAPRRPALALATMRPRLRQPGLDKQPVNSLQSAPRVRVFDAAMTFAA